MPMSTLETRLTTPRRLQPYRYPSLVVTSAVAPTPAISSFSGTSLFVGGQGGDHPCGRSSERSPVNEQPLSFLSQQENNGAGLFFENQACRFLSRFFTPHLSSSLPSWLHLLFLTALLRAVICRISFPTGRTIPYPTAAFLSACFTLGHTRKALWIEAKLVYTPNFRGFMPMEKYHSVTGDQRYPCKLLVLLSGHDLATRHSVKQLCRLRLFWPTQYRRVYLQA
jgi:hypothetical protein